MVATTTLYFVVRDQSYDSRDNGTEDILPYFQPRRHPSLHLPDVIRRKDHR
uniref:Uncharacterized protein n=1 Tax=Arion vulgaris TaxID=1028688 RepID=A0A0B7ADU5_9EUPU